MTHATFWICFEKLTKSQESDAERSGVLRANRSLCCLELGDHQQALAEAQRATELRPGWAKAHFRLATAHKALGSLGEARLAACAARRLAPDVAIEALLLELRRELFAGCLGLGEALDTLEDFVVGPEKVRAAAQAVRDELRGHEEQVLRAFMASAGPKTIFRRQNAMGDNWQEECRNGTMSLLSEISQSGEGPKFLDGRAV